MDELKPCPFCGAKAVLGVTNMGHGVYGALVRCTDCGCRSNAYSPRVDWCANDMAIRSWNRREEDVV